MPSKRLPVTRGAAGAVERRRHAVQLMIPGTPAADRPSWAIRREGGEPSSSAAKTRRLRRLERSLRVR